MWTKLFLIALVVSVCAANPAKGPKPSIGKPPHITPGFGSYMVGGAGGGFPGLAADNVPSGNSEFGSGISSIGKH